MIKYGENDKFTLDGKEDEITIILNYIQDNYTSITMSRLTEHFNYSEAYLCRVLKGSTNKTFSEILRSIWIEKAKQLIRCNIFPANKIGELVGYNSASVFVRAFRKETGVSPAEYVKNQNM